MLEGLRSAAAGMVAQQQRLDAVANDLANANTNGYKHQRVGFRDLVYQQAGRPAAPGVRTGAGAAAVDAGRSFEQGPLRSTGQPLDVAISGEGFLQVRLPDGRLALTRDGELHADPSRRLVTETGALVQPALTLPQGVSPEQVAIASDGTVTARSGAGRQLTLGRIALVTVRSPQGLASAGDNAFTVTAASGPALAAPRTTTLQQGTLEAANVEVADAMASMIEAQRSFELASRAIHTQDQMLEIANGVKR
jgi:flagellar basal-body rod protein FlgG